MTPEQEAGAGTRSTDGRKVALYFPPEDKDDWETVDPTSIGWNKDGIEEVLRYADQANSSGLVVLYQGRIVVERYWRGAGVHSSGDIASAQKSMTSMLVGIAQEEGLLQIAGAVSKYLGEGWSNAPQAAESKITLRHLLTMASGLNDALEYEADAGSTWYYNTPAYHLLKTAIENTSGKSISEYSATKLFRRIGMRDSEWRERPLMLAPLGAKDTAAKVTPKPLTGLVASTRDMARFGLLAMNDGAWNGEDVIRDKAYFADSLRTSQKLNLSYGYLWWLNGKDSYVLPGRGNSGDGPLVPPAPHDLFMALGAGTKRSMWRRAWASW